MKIGTLTFWNTEDNYGQLLQNYALQNYLRSIGHDTFLIRTVSADNKQIGQLIRGNMIAMVRAFLRLHKWPIYSIRYFIMSTINMLRTRRFELKQVDRSFEEFRKRHLNSSPIYTISQLRKSPPSADAYIVGSDQVWNTTDGVYFLNWAKDDVKKISYAASFGARESDEDFCSLIKPWLDRFDLISLREQKGVDICHRLGYKDAAIVPDPTLLLEKEAYLKMASNKLVPKEKYMFVYFLGTRTNIEWKSIRRIANKKDLRIIYVGSQGQIDKYHKLYPTIEEWLGLIAHADYVVTNSFHGTVFSLIFEKLFTTLPITGHSASMNNRLETLLYPMGLMCRVGNLDNFSAINYCDVNKHLIAARNLGKTFLSLV